MVSTWNRDFNEAAEKCGLSAADLLEIEDGTVIGNHTWMRYGEKVQVAIGGTAIWTVSVSDLAKASA